MEKRSFRQLEQELFNQAIKAVAIARGFVATSDLDLVCILGFVGLKINSEQKPAIKILVEPRVNVLNF